jgi:hypothetical protein
VLVKEKPTYRQAGTNHGGEKCMVGEGKTLTTAVKNVWLVKEKHQPRRWNIVTNVWLVKEKPTYRQAGINHGG